MKPYANVSGFKYYEYISTHVDDRMTISDYCDKIIKRLEETHALGGVKELFYENPRYLGEMVGVYDLKKILGIAGDLTIHDIGLMSGQVPTCD